MCSYWTFDKINTNTKHKTFLAMTFARYLLQKAIIYHVLCLQMLDMFIHSKLLQFIWQQEQTNTLE